MARGVYESSSDEEGDYQAVDQISESGEDEPDVEKVEERFIIDSEEENDDHGASTLRVPSSKESNVAHQGESESSSEADVHGGSVGEWEGLDLDDGLFSSDLPHFDDHFARTNPFLASEIEVFNAVNAYDRAGSEPIPETKHVRFEDSILRSDSSTTSTSSEDDDVFPDLFVPHSRLDPEFRRLIDEDHHHHATAPEDISSWALSSGDALGSNVELEDSSAFSTLDSSSSGYETDEGETTDEDLPPPPTIARTRSVLRPLSRSPSSHDDDDDSEESHRPVPSRRSTRHRRGPSLGSWVADPRKPIAVLDSSGKRLVIYPAQRPPRPDNRFLGASFSYDSSPISASPQTPMASLADDSENDHGLMMNGRGSVLSGPGTNLMMGGLLHGVPSTEQSAAGSQLFGPPEAFYQFWDPAMNSALNTDDDDDGDHQVDDDEAMLNVDDFLDFGDSSSSDGDEAEEKKTKSSRRFSSSSKADADMCLDSSAQSPPRLSERRFSGTKTNNSFSERLLNHLDRGVVTSFRRNQLRPKARHSASSRSALRDDSPFMPKAAFEKNLLRGNRHSGNPSHVVAAAAAAANKKRKFSTPAVGPFFGVEPTRNITPAHGGHGHKRHRSGLV
ncbi:MAG: hypothetical protein M4579_005686 [Chaenotheca gracillima]|nr:MAG: hypothetical protein M4579_005686 [Chaenotheca gracillima]